jgi:transposase
MSLGLTRGLPAIEAAPEAVRRIAWKAQTRLCQRYRKMIAKGKPKPLAVTAVARDLAGFIWAVAQLPGDVV